MSGDRPRPTFRQGQHVLTRVLMVAVVVALLTIPARPAVGADERWLLRGLLDSEAWNTDPSSALLSRDQGDLTPAGELRLWFAADLHSRVQAVVVGQATGGDPHQSTGVDSSIEQAYVRTTLGKARRMFIDVGRLQTHLGNFAARYPSSSNPLIGEPLGYTRSYPLGVTFSGAIARVDYRLGLVDEPLVNDRFLPEADSVLRPSASLGVTPIRGLRLGSYYTRGPYLNRELQAFVPAGQSWRDFGQRVLGFDLHFSRRYLEVNADYSRSRYEVPTLDRSLGGSAAFVELKHVIRPRWFVALRGSRNAYVEVRTPTGSPWPAIRSRFDDVELGAGFRPSRSLLVKLAYRETSWEQDIYPKGRALAAQLSYGFDVREGASRLNGDRAR